MLATPPPDPTNLMLARWSPFLVSAALTAGATAQMSGQYFINKQLPLTTVTFPSFADATAALAAQGVGGPCEFLVYDDGGVYDESNPFATNNGTYGNNDAVLVMTSWTGASASNRVTFRAAAGERPILDATGRAMGVFWGGADYVTLEGLEIRGAIFDGITLYAEAQHGVAQDPIIDSCRIHDCQGTAITIYGNSSQPANTLVQNCTMWSCQQSGGGAFSTTGRFGYISTRRTNGTRIVHNTFYVDSISNNSNYCVLGSRCSGITEVPFAEVSNNIFVKLVSSNTPLFRFYVPTGSATPVPPICDSNCFFDVSGGDFALYGDLAATTAATLADWQTAGYDLTSIAADPVLRDVTTADFHLTASSPCISASTVAGGPTEDFEGQARTAMLDIGADEYSGATYSLVGTGCAGSGLAPTLDLWSWPFLGNQNFAIGFEATDPGAIVGLFGSIGVSPTPLPIGAGCNAYLDPATLVALSATQASTDGRGSFVFPVPNNPAFVGFNIGYQGLALDATAPLGFTVTNGIDATFDF